MSKPSAAVAAAAVSSKQEVPQDKLSRLEKHLTDARDLEREITSLEERLSEMRQQLNGLYSKTIPDLFDECKMEAFTLQADGNYPAIEYEMKPYYSANIAATWPEEKRRAAFDWLEKNGHGDLIKVDVISSFERGRKEQAEKFFESVCKKKGVSAKFKETVHPQTLTAFVKEMVEEKGVMPPLELLGASVGRVVKPKVKRA